MAEVKEGTGKTHPDQQYIPGAEPERNNKVHAAATAYRKARDARMKLTEQEDVTKTKLAEVMEAEDLEVYNDPSGYAVVTTATHNVKLMDKPRGKKAE